MSSAEHLPVEEEQTERLTDEQVSIERAYRLEAIFEAMTDAVLVFDREGNIVQLNAAAHDLLQVDEFPGFVGMPLEQRYELLRVEDRYGKLCPREEWPLKRILRGEALQGKQAVDVVFSLPMARGMCVSVTGAPVRDWHGEIIGAVLVLHDVTERRQSELALLEANRRFDEFLSIASHELRTPLTTIKGNIQLVMRRLDQLERLVSTGEKVPASQLERIRSPLLYAEQRVNAQNRMINDLLDVSRAQVNELSLVLHPCSLATIVRDTVEDQRYLTPERAITLDLPDGWTALVVADADRIAQVVHNYLTNALKYSPPDRPISVYMERDGGVARVCVRDEGPGLSAEEQPCIWERFYRAKETEVQSGSHMGLGLGLYICRMIIEYHGGHYGIQSVRGEGSVFWFTLPLTQEI
jgi:signal transduction histidine kinase